MWEKTIEEIIIEMFDFFNNEQKYRNKSDSFMTKIYKNRVQDVVWDNDINVTAHLFDKIWYYYFKYDNPNSHIHTLIHWFDELLWDDMWLTGLLEFRKTSINVNAL